MPATLYWLAAINTDASQVGNWTEDPVYMTPSSLLPHDGDTVIFDAAVSGADCVGLVAIPPEGSGGGGEGEIGPWTPIPGQFEAVRLLDGYGGTVTHNLPLDTEVLEVRDGQLDPTFAGVGIHISAEFTWTGGVINTTEYSADLELDGATGTIDFGDGEEWETANTLLLTNAAEVTHYSGAVNFTAGDGVDIAALCVFLIAAPPGGAPSTSPALKDASNGPLLVLIQPLGECDVTANWTSELPVHNDGGRFHLAVRINATIKNTYGPGNPAFQQTTTSTGRTDLDGGSVLTLEEGTGNGRMVMAGGSLWVRPTATWQTSTIFGNLTVSGGFIQYDLSALNTAAGILKVGGDVTWTGGQLNAGYDATRNGNATYWEVTGTMTITGGPGGATVLPVKVNGPAAPSTGWRYHIIGAGSGITGTPNNGGVSMNLVAVGAPVVMEIDLVAP